MYICRRVRSSVQNVCSLDLPCQDDEDEVSLSLGWFTVSLAKQSHASPSDVLVHAGLNPGQGHTSPRASVRLRLRRERKP